jgi:hypothetical protein
VGTLSSRVATDEIKRSEELYRIFEFNIHPCAAEILYVDMTCSSLRLSGVGANSFQ